MKEPKGKAKLLEQEEKLQAMVNKTEQLQTENHANLTTVSKLNDTVEILEVKNHELKMKFNDCTIHSVEAEELLQIEKQSDEMIKKLNLQLNNRNKERQVDHHKSEVYWLMFEFQRLKGIKEKKLITKDKSHCEANTKLKKKCKQISAHILQYQQEKDLLNKRSMNRQRNSLWGQLRKKKIM